MEELLKYFEGIELPTEPLKINSFATIANATDGKIFIDSCVRYHEKGKPRGFLQLSEYKAAVEKYYEQPATEES